MLFLDDAIVISLPGFTGVAVELLNDAGTLSKPNNAVKSVTWRPDAYQMTILMARDIEIAEIIQVFVPVSAKLALPAGGVSRNQETVTIACEGRAGRIDPSPIQDTAFIDSLISKASMSFYPKKAGAPVTILFSFSTQVLLREKQELTIFLPDFGDGKSGSILMVSSRPLDMLEPTASWNPVPFLLTLVVRKNLDVGAFLNVTIPDSEIYRPRSNAVRAKSALAVKQ